jgi:hypothetical protein
MRLIWIAALLVAPSQAQPFQCHLIPSSPGFEQTRDFRRWRGVHRKKLYPVVVFAFPFRLPARKGK